jgi:hypothetical protein
VLKRRSFLHAGAGFIAAQFDTLASDRSVKRYRADATVTFLGIPIFSRAGVGSATIAVERKPGALALLFQAGSLPDRTRGLNRLGYIEETVTERGSDAVESSYFGFITASGEESLEQAKAALGGTGKDAVVYTAVEGSANARTASFDLFQMKLPPSYDFSKCDDVVRRVRESIARKEIAPARRESTSAETARTFLYALRQAMLSAQPKAAVAFLYNGKRYRLESQVSADRKAGEQFAAKKLIASPDSIRRLNGTIQNVATRDKTSFRLWFEQGRELPVRFEYKAKSYLNLAFEQA